MFLRECGLRVWKLPATGIFLLWEGGGHFAVGLGALHGVKSLSDLALFLSNMYFVAVIPARSNLPFILKARSSFFLSNWAPFTCYSLTQVGSYNFV